MRIARAARRRASRLHAAYSLGPRPPVKKAAMPYDEDEEMDMMSLDPLAEALALPDIMSNPEPHPHAWSSGVSTPTHSNHWSTAAGSPTSSHLSSDMLMNASSSPFMQRRSDVNNNMGMIGKSAWGTDWFSPNPRLDPSSNRRSRLVIDLSRPPLSCLALFISSAQPGRSGQI
ncbi:hypothetical protein FA13DRAFT_1798346 [Coprinellus micaceus]|uniref:Uncharacterized protein n=1 Tax=Coprinellus micaceus TaxID=71717 RepID=A0A4Y7SMK6_COPMI|nr:hypothetical protein FA13DRAFT_1798346 [Coprinellus micaceus]